MAIIFKPTGYLNISADPMELPAQVEGKNVVSGAITRCKNLDLNNIGIAKTRLGSSYKSTTKINRKINHLQIMDGVRYEFGGDQIFADEVSLITGLTAANWDSLVYKAYNETSQSIFALNGTDRKRVQGSTVSEWGIEAPTEAPTVTGEYDYGVTYEWELTYLPTSLSGYKFTIKQEAGYDVCFQWEKAYLDRENYSFTEKAAFVTTVFSDLVADRGGEYAEYKIKITYARYSNSVLVAESNPSPEAHSNIKSGLLVSWKAPTDQQITHVRVYRTLAGFNDFYYADEFPVADGVGVVMTPDEALGSLAPTDHDRPPAGTLVAGPDFNGVCFLAWKQYLYYSKAKQPEYWPKLYNIECGIDQSPIMGLAFLSGQLFAATEKEIYQIQGSGVESFFPLPMAAITGTKSSKVFLPIKGYGIFHLGYDGLYLYTASSDLRISGKTLSPIFNYETRGGIPYIDKTKLNNCIMARTDSKVWFGYPGPGSTYCDNFLVLTLESNLLEGITGKVSYYSYPVAFTALQVDTARNELLAVDTAGYVWRLDDPGSETDDVTAIAWELESKEFGGLRKYFPRWARYDVELGTGATAYGHVVLNNAVRQTHPLTGSRRTNKRLIDGYNGDRLSIRLSGTGPVSIYSAEVE